MRTILLAVLLAVPSTVLGQQPNKVTIYSNGIADFRTHYQVPKGKDFKITIPVKQKQVGDVLSTLDVFGKVTLSKPASFPQDQV